MSMYCERCHQTSYGTTIKCDHCGLSAERKSIHERLDKFRIWLDYGDSYWRYPAWGAIFVLGAFCAVNGIIIFAMVIKWLWGFQ